FQTSVNTREFVQVGGVRYIFDSSKSPDERLISVEVNQEPLDESRVYTVVTNNYVASNLKAHFGISPKGLEIQRLPNIDREVLIERIRKEKSITSTLDGRIKNIAATGK
ncbi:MAG: 5'-nucleotidase C-terminal domain-containing protein, partial [Bacteroidota bacterium]